MRKRRSRKSRKNSFWGHPRLHSKAARKGWGRRKSRRTRRNAGGMSIVKQTTKSVREGFAPSTIKKATAILLGNISTTWYVDQIASRVPMIRSNPLFEIGSLLLLASGNALVAKRIWPKHANDILVGGILAGVTRAVKTVLPGRFPTCGLGEDSMDGMGDYSYVQGMGNLGSGGFIGPFVASRAFTMQGIDGYASPHAPTIGTHGLGDEAVYQQVQGNQGRNLVTLDGLANMAVMQEIESMS